MAFEKGMPRPDGAGRKKGTTNGDTAKLRELILGALDEVGGQDYLVQQAWNEPKAFLNLIAKVLPREVKQELIVNKIPESLEAFYNEINAQSES